MNPSKDRSTDRENFLTDRHYSLGCLFFIIGTVGLLRFPDVLTRIHALTKADNLGLGFIVIGLIPSMASAADVAKLVLCWLLILGASSVSAYLVANQHVKQTRKPE